MFGVQTGIVGGQVRVAGIAEYAFHKIQIGNQASGCEEADFHGFQAEETGYFGTNHRPNQQRDEHFGFFFLSVCKRKAQHVSRRIQRGLQKLGEDRLRYGFLVAGYRKSTLGDVETAFRGAPVIQRIVQDTLGDFVTF